MGDGERAPRFTRGKDILLDDPGGDFLVARGVRVTRRKRRAYTASAESPVNGAESQSRTVAGCGGTGPFSDTPVYGGSRVSGVGPSLGAGNASPGPNANPFQSPVHGASRGSA
jgi:hypothetical protein